MTTPYDHTPYLDQLTDDPHSFWESRIKACRWMIVKTTCLGVLAAALGILGQGWLEQAAPIFPFISQNYGLWQSAYLLSLVLVFLLWAFAMRQKFGLLHNSKQGLKTQRRIDEQNARIEERRRANRERREAVRKEREEHTIYFKASGGATASKKFDY
jgi:C4-dicarboxylate-specific signal transduction histidine kinase